MKEKLQAIYQKVLPYAQKAYAAAPFPVGVAAGYFGSPIIKLAIDAVRVALKLV